MRFLRLLGKGLAAVLILTAVALVSGAITVWLVAEKNKVQLPRVIGMDSAAALELLRQQGLQPKVSGREHNETIPRDAVIFQRPASGSWVRKNSEVRLVVSQGTDATALPGLAGLPPAAGRAAPLAIRLHARSGGAGSFIGASERRSHRSGSRSRRHCPKGKRSRGADQPRSAR